MEFNQEYQNLRIHYGFNVQGVNPNGSAFSIDIIVRTVEGTSRLRNASFEIRDYENEITRKPFLTTNQTYYLRKNISFKIPSSNRGRGRRVPLFIMYPSLYQTSVQSFKPLNSNETTT